MYLDYLDPIDRLIIKHQSYEQQEVNAFKQLICQHQIKRFIDIGANCGFYTCQMAQLGLKVDAFDLNQVAMGKLKKTLEKNPHIAEKVTLYNYGLSDTERLCSVAAQVKHGYVQTGGTSVVDKQILPHDFTRFSAKLRIGDNLLPYRNEHLALKIDVEGHEPEVMRGLEKLLTMNKCVVMLEIIDEKFGTYEALRHLLENYGYSLVTSVQEKNYFYSNCHEVISS